MSEIDFSKFHQYLKYNAKTYGPIYRISLANKPVVVLSEPALVRSLLKQRPERFRRISSIQSVFSELDINGVFSAEGDTWRKQRSLMNQAFNIKHIRQYYPIIQNSAVHLINILHSFSLQAQAFEIQPLLQRYLVDITTNLAFGHDFNSLQNPDSELLERISVIFPMISNRIKAPFPYWRFFKLSRDRKLERAITYIKNQSQTLISEAEERIKQNGTAKNILEAMILARDEDGNNFPNSQLFPNILTLLLAGEDTTANTLSWIIHYLIQHPEYQDTLFAEIQEYSPKLDLHDVQSLDSLPLLNAIIQEAMRMMPVTPFLYLENYFVENLEGFQIPEGTMLVLLLSQSGHDEKQFSHYEIFRPERWLDMPHNDLKNNSRKLMHFGGGPRQCPGMQLSFIEFKYTLIQIFSQFVFSHDIDSSNMHDHFDFTVAPKNLRVKIGIR